MSVRPPSHLGLLALSALALVAAPAGAQQRDDRPTLAVLYFTNGSMVNNAEYEPLSKGVAEMLITELSASPAIRVVERDRIQQILAEQDLAKGGRVEPETAARIGKLLGARHMLMGGFVIDRRENLRIDARAVNTETSQVEYVTSVSGKADDVLGLIAKLGERLNGGLKLPAIPKGGARPAAAEPSATMGTPSDIAAAPGRGGDRKSQFRAVMMLSRALNATDSGDSQQAVALYKQALTEYPPLTRARELLAVAETKATGDN